MLGVFEIKVRKSISIIKDLINGYFELETRTLHKNEAEFHQNMIGTSISDKTATKRAI